MKKSKLKKASTKTKLAQDVFYKITKPLWLSLHPACQFKLEGKFTCDETYGVTVHHKKGRGKYLNELAYFMTACMAHHRHIHDNPKESYKKGYLIKRL